MQLLVILLLYFCQVIFGRLFSVTPVKLKYVIFIWTCVRIIVSLLVAINWSCVHVSSFGCFSIAEVVHGFCKRTTS
uniref:Uncharacterized protein n=1 Tax=Arundo donax TaxID=35708 RepID=A0A0A9FUU9_ARUDO